MASMLDTSYCWAKECVREYVKVYAQQQEAGSHFRHVFEEVDFFLGFGRQVSHQIEYFVMPRCRAQSEYPYSLAFFVISFGSFSTNV